MSGVSIILASKSPARRMVLENAGISFSWCDARINEDEIKTRAVANGISPADLALSLAKAKATAACEAGTSDDIYLGCDQVLALDGRLFDKPADLSEARDHLRVFSGKPHQLISALCLVQSGDVIWSYIDTAHMHVRNLSDGFIDQYLSSEGEKILSSVGAYLLESAGAQLFRKIEGDYFTVLGLPLLPLLEELRKRGILVS